MGHRDRVRPEGHRERTWPATRRGTILIHATRWASEAEYGKDLEFIERVVGENKATDIVLHPEGNQFMVFGQIIGQADFVDCVDESPSPWFFGPYGFVLRNQRRVQPIVVRGHLGFWEYSGEVKVL